MNYEVLHPILHPILGGVALFSEAFLNYPACRLRVLRWMAALDNHVDDPAALLSIHKGHVAVGSMFGRVALLHAVPSPIIIPGEPRMALHSTICINLKDQKDAKVMPSKTERVASIHLTSKQKNWNLCIISHIFTLYYAHFFYISTPL